jgi:hypothetical protein
MVELVATAERHPNLIIQNFKCTFQALLFDLAGLALLNVLVAALLGVGP